MVKIIVFGTGSGAEKFLDSFSPESGEILFFVDNNKKKQFGKFHRYSIEPPERLLDAEFDFVVIASEFSREIEAQLLEMGIPIDKIVPFFYHSHFEAARDRHKAIIENLTGKRNKPHAGKWRIAVTNFNYSNSNGYAVFRSLPEHLSDKYEVALIGADQKERLRDYDVIVSSSFDGIYDGKHVNVELFHGFPLKRMGLMDELRTTPRYISYQEYRAKHVHRIASCSHLYTTFFNACYPMNIKKYRITGFPRNDLLFNKDGVEKLERLMNRELDGKNVVFYLPTWRKFKYYDWVDVDRDWNRLFHFPDEKESDIADMLEQLDLLLVVKLHPYEYHEYKNLDILRHDRVFLVTDEMLENERIHLYELFSAAKIMITDYSSVFFDTLLIDLPVVFAPTDLQRYREGRGFLLEPYQVLTPGPTVYDLASLKREIGRILEGKDPYQEARAKVRELVFFHHDNQSGRRVWQMIDEFLSNEAEDLMNGQKA